MTSKFILLALAALLAAPCLAQTPAGADPKINERFLNPGPEWQERFEGESREIYARRNDIVTTSGAKAGMTIADVGAGSGFMAMLFAKHVGPSGRVIAAEVSKVFAAAIAARAIKPFNGMGTLKKGAAADVAILELREGNFEYVDNYRNTRSYKQKLFPFATVLGGKRVPAKAA